MRLALCPGTNIHFPRVPDFPDLDPVYTLKSAVLSGEFGILFFFFNEVVCLFSAFFLSESKPATSVKYGEQSDLLNLPRYLTRFAWTVLRLHSLLSLLE